MKIAVVGASGFVGSAVSAELEGRGHQVMSVRCPRVQVDSGASLDGHIERLAAALVGADAVVNCAGVADAGGSDIGRLMAGNAFSAEVVAAACKLACINRFVHVSSAAVQGRRVPLDDSTQTHEFSLYSRSKAEGERRVRARNRQAVIYRPPGVHDAGRTVTSSLYRLASSPVSSVAGSGERGTPQALLGNVASAIAFLTCVEASPPEIISHPWEGITTQDLLLLLSGKKPMKLPVSIARVAVSIGLILGRHSATLTGNTRRLEVLWFGQEQSRSWLEEQGWTPPLGREAWVHLGEELRILHCVST